MKLKQGFILRDVAGQTIILSSGEELNLNMMITLNETGKFLWERLNTETNEETLVAALLAEYDVDETTAKAAVESFISTLNEHEFLAD